MPSFISSSSWHVFSQNISMLTCSANSLFRKVLTILLPWLRSLSDGTLVPQMHRYLRANDTKTGNFFCSSLHHVNGSKSTSTGGYSSYRFISLSTFFSCERSLSLSLDVPKHWYKIAPSPFLFFFGCRLPSGFSTKWSVVAFSSSLSKLQLPLASIDRSLHPYPLHIFHKILSYTCPAVSP